MSKLTVIKIGEQKLRSPDGKVSIMNIYKAFDGGCLKDVIQFGFMGHPRLCTKAIPLYTDSSKKLKNTKSETIISFGESIAPLIVEYIETQRKRKKRLSECGYDT